MNIPSIYDDLMCQAISIERIKYWSTRDVVENPRKDEIRSQINTTGNEWIQNGINILDPLYNSVVKIFRKNHGSLTDRLISIVKSSVQLCKFRGVVDSIDSIEFCESVESINCISFQKYLEINKKLRIILVDILFSNAVMTTEGIENLFNEIDKLIKHLSDIKNRYKFQICGCDCDQQISKKRNFSEINYITPSCVEPKIIVQPPNIEFPINIPAKKPRLSQVQTIEQLPLRQSTSRQSISRQSISRQSTSRQSTAPEIIYVVREPDSIYTDFAYNKRQFGLRSYNPQEDSQILSQMVVIR
ncbi:hypothetical protein [Acanthamoeba castellanii mimivirus]|jgi:hypothetical protein|uniref:Uncharacterized protein L698 n=5 Tax=Mimivirus TaxID=315393 RepID=YL698_MIMIV|nr:hypothetical protein MIMI_gp0756 [Acanthamoeba polyphaga mimivirus]Q5UNV7.1 RecName: Full=Uncharacterized protein L698 [Acanthamoeba polyphaga mimivirus]AHA45136.1 hypothetical protein HIRU_S230 [Hirudovirus strain Sangsue]ALR84320.1 hypothetical protein [Niemeyer virus]AMK62003.1 hypothetical protein [Samba virus]AMZ03142.1 hypothetical protein [Mimivirus Bombay]BAV61829.1 hypothetical protein [Acanthamoeba castellanii mimivirus]